MDHMQVYLQAQVVAFHVVQAVEPHTGSVGYCSLEIINVRDSIKFQTRPVFFITALYSRDGAALP